MKSEKENEEVCCPRFDPTNWEDKTIIWENKKFIKAKVWTFFFIPLNFGAVMKKLNRVLEAARAKNPDNLCLSYHNSKWNMDLYLAVDVALPGAENTSLSGKYYSKVYEGDFKQTGEWMKDFESKAKAKGLNPKKIFMWYTTCPKCAKKYGENYVVLLSEV